MRLNSAIVVLMTCLVGATYGFGIYLFAQLVPDMRSDLGFDLAYVGTVTASGQLGFLVCALLGAWLTPNVGGGWVILSSGFVCAIALLLMPLTNDIYIIGILLTLLAGSAATVFVPMVDVVTRVVAYRYRGMVMGLVSSGTSYGVFINSLLVPIYAPKGEWRTIWWQEGLFTMVMCVLVLWAFKQGGLLNKPQISISDSKAIESNLSQVLQSSNKKDLLKSWVLMIWSMNFLIGFSTFPFQNYLSSYLRTELNFGVDYTAHIWAVIGVVGMFSGLALGWLSDKIGLRVAMLLAYSCIVFSALIFVYYPSGSWPIVAGVLFSTAFYPIFGLIPAYVSKLATSTSSAVMIFGIANVMQGTGGMLGNYGAGLLASHSNTFTTIYGAIALVSMILMLLTIKLPKTSLAIAP